MKIDKRISKYCEKKELIYTRYADDITISSKRYVSVTEYNKIKDFIKMVITDDNYLNLKLNESKCHRFTSAHKMIVTGINVNTKANVSKKVYRELDNAIRYIEKYGLGEHLKNIDSDYIFYDSYLYEDHLIGLCNFINLVNPKKANFYKNKILSLKLTSKVSEIEVKSIVEI